MKRLANTIISASWVAGVGLTVWGLSRTKIPLSFFEHWEVLPGYWKFLIFCLPVLVLIGGLIPSGFLGGGILLFLLIGAALGGVWPILVVMWFIVAAILLGRILLSVLGNCGQNRNWVVDFLIGAGLYGTLVGLIAHFPVSYPGLYGVALAAPLAAKLRDAIQLAKDAVHWLTAYQPKRWLELPIVVIALLYLTVAFMPEIGHDALAMHLFVPAHLAWRSEWGFDVETYIWAVMPMLGDWIYSIGYMLAGETAARLINVGFVLVLSWIIRDIVLWAGGTLMGANWAVLIFLSAPLTYTESSSLFIESIWGAYITAGVLLFLRAVMSTELNHYKLRVAGSLFGFAIAAKAISFMVLPSIILLFLVSYRHWWKAESVVSILIGVGGLVAFGIIPYVTAYILTGNPVFPFYNQIFQSEYYLPVNFDSSSLFGQGLSWDILYSATFNSGKYIEGGAGAPGFQWLLLFVPASLVLLISANRKGLALLFIAVTTIALVFMSVTYLRYIYPAIALAVAGIGVGLSAFLAGGVAVRALTSMIACVTVGLNLVFLTSGTYYGALEVRPLLNESGRKDYLENRLPIRIAVDVVNSINTANAPVAVFGQAMAAGLVANALYPNWYNPGFQRRIEHAGSRDQIADVLVEYGVHYVILDAQFSNQSVREMLIGATDVVSVIRHIEVRRLRSEYRFHTELLTNTSFSESKGWTWVSGELEKATDGVVVNVDRLGYQIVPVIPELFYKYTVSARCADMPTQGRLQVNWLDAKKKYIEATIEVFDCAKTRTQHSAEFSSPQGAAYAIVYVTGHTQIPLVINEASFRR